MNEDRKLSITQRYLLTYIKFRTNNNHQFYAQNKAISEVIGCTVDSTKVIINKLIREGYLLLYTCFSYLSSNNYKPSVGKS